MATLPLSPLTLDGRTQRSLIATALPSPKLPKRVSTPTSPGFVRPASPALTATTTSARAAVTASNNTSNNTSLSSRIVTTMDDDQRKTTSVQVAVRIRPPLKPSDPGYELIPPRFQRTQVHAISPTSLTVNAPQGRKLFTFDRVFDPSVTQAGIWEYLSESIDRFAQGYNVSILAYGQSGAGKSFTMGTSGLTDQQDTSLSGVIPRASTAIFEKLDALNKRLSTTTDATSATDRNSVGEGLWQLKATYVEIYNEHLRDLLIPENVPASERGVVMIREDPKGRILLTGLSSHTVNSPEDIARLLQFGSSIRQTDATAINAISSRSHAIFTLNLVQRGTSTPRMKHRSSTLEGLTSPDVPGLDSKIHFVDLAGSERMKNTGASGERAKEGIAINSGLASLGKVIAQLSSSQTHSYISYRDSKLTRVLQDSLGGNAYTYMIACVTPADFHLSETLNTVQYASRARAIQSKPELQQTFDDSQKQAVIDRLRNELSVLRERLRQSEEQSGHGATPTSDRGEGRASTKEVELENRLLDVQESYAALSRRHHTLMTQIAKSREESAAHSAIVSKDDKDAVDAETAEERAQKSASFAEAVDQMVSEYEATIQTLESSLSNTKASLATAETTINQRDSKISYNDTVNKQLRARIQRLIERESSTDQYARVLEERTDHQDAGTDARSEIIKEMRQEIDRLRENEALTEDYIASLEEKAAEIDQETETMQREIERLVTVVERQRSVAALNPSVPVAKSATETAEPSDKVPPGEETLQSAFLEEKLESINQELFDLRVEHESTATNYDLLSAKYAEALRTLATMQESLDDHAQSNGDGAFLPTARINELRQLANGHSSDATSEYAASNSTAQPAPSTSSIGESLQGYVDQDGNAVPSEAQAFVKAASPVTSAPSAPSSLAMTSAPSSLAMVELEAKFKELQAEHEETLDFIEELKREVYRAKQRTPTSPQSSSLIRRKISSQPVTMDRAHRSFAVLDNIAAENLTDKPDIKENFDASVSSIMQELHKHSERAAALDAEVANMKKDVESKSLIITGLTRERSSMAIKSAAASPALDDVAVQNLKQQADLSEAKVKAVQLEAVEKQKVLEAEILSLKETIRQSGSTYEDAGEEQGESGEKAVEGEKEVKEHEPTTNGVKSDASLEEITTLKAQLAQLQEAHDSNLGSFQANENALIDTIQELEIALTSVEQKRQEILADLQNQKNLTKTSFAAFETERTEHSRAIDALKSTIDGHVVTHQEHLARIAELEHASETSNNILADAALLRETNDQLVNDHRAERETLQSTIDGHVTTIAELKEAHAQELESIRANANTEAKARSSSEVESKISAMTIRHNAELKDMQSRVMELESATDDGGTSTYYRNRVGELEADIEDLKRELAVSGSATKLKDDLNALTLRLQTVSDLKDELQERSDALRKEVLELQKKDERSARIVEDLEAQLSLTYEDTRTVNSRLSTMQSSRDKELQTAKEAVVSARDEIAGLNARIAVLESTPGTPQVNEYSERTPSMTNSIRKSVAVSSLPSPPPAIPLPPLPAGAPLPGSQSPPSTSHAHRSNSLTTQRIEEQEMRIRTIEKHLFAEKQLTATLEEALVDLETQGNKVRGELETWKGKAWAYEEELVALRKERMNQRQSIQAYEQERGARMEAEAERRKLEDRMTQLAGSRKKKNALNCF